MTPLRWSLVLIGLGVGLAGTACDSGPLPDPQAQATATVLGCYSAGSYPHTTSTASPTPTGTWTRPTATPYPTPVRCAAPPCELPTGTPLAPPHWPPPAVTCTLGPDQPTLTPWPTAPPAALWPPQPAQPPLPSLVGLGQPVMLSTGLGSALLGGIATDPRTGWPWLVWSQANLDRNAAGSARVYLRTLDPATATWRAPQALPISDLATGPDGLPQTTVAVGPAGQVDVALVRWTGGGALVTLWESPEGATWPDPVTFADGGSSAVYGLRLAFDTAGYRHLAYIRRPASDTGGQIFYWVEDTPGHWLLDTPPGADTPTPRCVDFALSASGDRAGTVLSWVRDSAVEISRQGPDGQWSRPQTLVEGAANPYGIPDYSPCGELPPRAGQFRSLAFTDGAGTPWIYLFWSIYSTGRIAFVFSHDGGVSWGPGSGDWPEDAVAYYPRFAYPTPPPAARSYATVHNPVPFWDAPSGRVGVIYQFCDRRPETTGGCWPAYAYGVPGAPGVAWTATANGPGGLSFAGVPLALLRTTAQNDARFLSATTAPGTGTGAVWLGWVERNRISRALEVYSLPVFPRTLFGTGGAPAPGVSP